ncbi:hypothetical protein [Capsulimonas corticalis]|uniref:hypothetical protein n=1 Tax=Capsulimonas corticalis TaxID=2219043 RepID=UPI001402969E|nr:hypothetical protein [Capsulimonas corticalis]
MTMWLSCSHAASNGGTLGRGFWPTPQTVDRVNLLTNATAFLEQDCVTEEPVWRK